MGWDGTKLGLMEYAAVREAAARMEDRAGEILGCLLGPRTMVRVDGAQRLPFEELQGLLRSIETDGPCLCCSLAGDLDGRLVFWPPVLTGRGTGLSCGELEGSHELLAEALAESLIPALSECSELAFAAGPLRLKTGPCHLPEDWDQDAEAWVLSVHIRANSKPYHVRVALFVPCSDGITLYRALCLEEAA